MAHRCGVLDHKYQFEYDVGLWTFGTVQVLRDRNSGELRTCKTVPKSRVRSPRDVFARLRRLQELQHAHISSIVDVLEDQSRFFIISEKCPGGDVAEWMVRVQEEGNWLQEQTVAEYVRQALIAIAHSHSNRVCHRDLRPSSLALTSKMPDAQVKVCDLGLASILDPEDAVARKSPSPYTAPEISAGFGRILPGAPDLWSIGAIAQSLLIGHAPCHDETGWGVGAGFLSRRRDHDGWSDRSALSRDFVQQLLQQAGDSPTAARALHHPWLKAVMPLDASLWSAGADAARETQHKLLCYMLALLLVPDLAQYRDYYQLRCAFVQTDVDHDGFVSRHFLHKMLKDHGVTSEAAAAALDIADVRGTDALDLCATSCADLIAREFFGGGQCLGATELAPQMLKRFFQSYGDPQRLVATTAGLNTRLCTATMRDVETYAGVRYDEILATLPENGTIDSQILAAELAGNAGRGTPLCHCEQEAPGHESSWGDTLNIEGLGDFVSSVFQTCGLSHDKHPRGYRMLIGS